MADTVKNLRGMKIELKDEKIYPTYDSKTYSSIVNGTYWIYDEKVRNNRIRITDSEDKVGKPCMMTGWIDTVKTFDYSFNKV